MSISEHIHFLQSIAARLADTQVDDALTSTLDMIGLVKLRLAEQGLSASGAPFTDYNPIYAQKRKDKGLQVGHKDFNVTGELYRSIKPEISAQSIGTIQVDITVRGTDNQVKVRGQVKRDGFILQPSPSEIQTVALAQSRRRIQRAQDLFNETTN